MKELITFAILVVLTFGIIWFILSGGNFTIPADFFPSGWVKTNQ